MLERRERAPKDRTCYTLIINGRPCKTGGYKSVKSAYDAISLYAELIPPTHRVPYLIAIGDHHATDGDGTANYII